MSRFAAAIVAGLVLASPSSAFAQGGYNAPPGNSSIDQYFESVPAADGRNTTTRPGQQGPFAPGVPGFSNGNNAAGGSPAIRPNVDRALANMGADGRAVAQFAEATSPSSGRRGSRTGRAGSSGTGRGAEAPGGVGGVSAVAPGEAPAKSLFSTAVGSSNTDGLGSLFPLLLAAVLGGGAAIAVYRRLKASEK